MTKTVDTLGMLCPTPLILTKKAINEAAEGDTIRVIVDNEMAFTNLSSYLKELKIEFTSTNDGTNYRFEFAKPAEQLNDIDASGFCSTSSNYVVVIKSEVMGTGSDELGRLLMRSFVNSLKEADRLPSDIILYNAGVKLAVKGCDTALSLHELEERGVGIIACGTCVDFFDIKETLSVGAIGNMFTITKIVSEAGSVIYP